MISITIGQNFKKAFRILTFVNSHKLANFFLTCLLKILLVFMQKCLIHASEQYFFCDNNIYNFNWNA